MPDIPAVDNITVEPRGQIQYRSDINGQSETTLTYNYVVRSDTPGDYVIPSVGVIVAGQNYATKPLKLKVLEVTAGQTPVPNKPAAGVGAEADAGEKQFGFLTVDLVGSDRKHVYVGEIAPVCIRAWMPANARFEFRSDIQPEAKGFTLHHVNQHSQQRLPAADGKLHTVVTWYGGISAAKAGTLPVSLSLDTVIAMLDPSESGRRQRNVIQKQVTLKSQDQEMEVRPLPTEGRPEEFSGAVGEFAFHEVNIPSRWKTGEPQQVYTSIKGSGNFALMKAPALTPPDSWKTYEGRDEFAAGDQAAFSGTKAFQFSVVSKKAGERDAALAFSYFDPVAEKYQTITSPVVKIEVTGKDMVEDTPVAAPVVKVPEKKAAGLVGQHLKLKPASSLVPLASRPVMDIFVALNAVMIAVGGVLAMLRRRRENPARLAKAAMEKATREALAVAGAAQDVQGFFSAARLAIQQRLGLLWNQPPQAITTAEVNGRIPEDSPVVRFFREADRYEYSRQNSGEVLPQWRALLAEALASLTSNAR